MSANAETVGMLRAVPLFGSLTTADLERIAATATEVAYEPGQVLIEARAPGSGMFVILEGRVSVHAHGVETELGPGEPVGELALLRRDAHRVARVQAITPVRCLAIDRSSFRELLTSHADLTVALLETVADRVPD